MSLKAMLGGLALCAALGAGTNASACSCEPPPPPAAAFAEAHAVFRGTVVEVQGTDELPRWELRPFYFVVRFRVTTAWKGVSDSEFTLGTGQGGGDCGKSFERGVEYVVYAYRNDRSTAALVEQSKDAGMSWPDFTTDICTRTARSRDAGEDRAFLSSKKSLQLRAHAQRAPPSSRKK